MAADKSTKPLGRKAYGSIGHLPNSRLGPGDHRVADGQAKIATFRARDKHDRIIVQEKVDGSCVAVTKVDGVIVPLGRAGYPAVTSRFEMHQLFAQWVWSNADLFKWLPERHRVVGEWLAQAHGTRYNLRHDPFVAFDVMVGQRRFTYDEFLAAIPGRMTRVTTIHTGGPFSVNDAMMILGNSNLVHYNGRAAREYGFHGALDPVEGAVWRVERKGEVDFLAKYLRPDKVDGCYLPEVSGKSPVWNWRPKSNG